MEVEIRGDALTPSIYTQIRATAGFQPYATADVTRALQGTLYSIVAYEPHTKAPIGIGRVVGDGRVCFFFKDIVVTPAFQHRGVGESLVRYLLDWVSRQACRDAYVGLMSTPGEEGFYERFGFTRRPTVGLGAGMVQFINQAESPVSAVSRPLATPLAGSVAATAAPALPSSAVLPIPTSIPTSTSIPTPK